MSNFSIIGKPIAMVDAAGKTTGAGKYTDDLSLPGMLVGMILHSPYPHARIRRIDTSRARALDGVVAVVTGADAPNRYGILPVGHDETALAVDKVRYIGDNVACVAAINEEVAEEALELIEVDYELLPAYFDPEQSMKAESDLIHEHRPHNIEKDYHHVFGDPDQGFAEAGYIHEARYIANEVTHAAMEPHSTLASFELDPHTGTLGRLTVWSSTQVPYYLQHKLSLVLEMPMSQIRVIKPLVGGGFGGKSAGEDHLHARGGLLGTPRPPAYDHRSQDRREERWPRDRSRMQGDSRWRRILLLRCGNNSVFRRLAGCTV